MIDSLLRQRDRMDAYVSMVPELLADKLLEQDWDDLKEVFELLKPFKMLTMLKNSLYGSIGSILWGIDMLLTVLEDV